MRLGIIVCCMWLAISPAAATTVNPRAEFDLAIANVRETMQTDPNDANRQAALAGRLAVRIPDQTQRSIAQATAEWLQGEAYLRINDAVSAAPHITRAMSITLRMDPQSILRGNVLMASGGLHGSRGEVAAALGDYQAAHEIFRKRNDTRNRAIALMLIASLYSDGNDNQTSLRYLGQALDVYRGDPSLLISIYNNRADNFQGMGRFDEAEGQYRQALNLASQMNSPLLRARVLGNMARTWLKADQLGAATSSIDSAMALAARGDAAAWRPQLLAIAAKIALQHGDRARAVKLINERFAGVDPATTTLSFREAHEAAYAVFKALGEPDKALVHLAALKRLDDQAAKLATGTNTALMAARFDFANQELKISQLKQDELQRSVAFEQARAQTQRYVFLGSAGAVSIIIGMLAFALVTMRQGRDKVRAANDDLAVTNSALGKALAAKTEFLATTSHEIRTPLNGILGMTQVMLADAKLAPELRDRLGVVHGAGITMRALVDDILDVAKMETGNLTIESAPFDLCATVTDATRLWEEQARAKGLTFDLDLSACPAMIMGDAARVRQIVFNLLSNALKFTAAGRVALKVEAQGDSLHVDVTDSGIGIPTAKFEEIFESFRQADAGTTRQFGGTGLGLSICRNLARAMGGEVSVTSVEGQGATFSLVLPLVRAADVAKPSIAEDAVVTLIVDRNPITRSMFKTLLSPHSDVIVYAASVEEAVTRLAEQRVRYVLIDDATMRVGAAPLEAIGTIVAAAGDTTTTTLLWPVSADVERDELLATGVTRVLAKPVSGAALIAAILDKPVAKNNAIPDLVSQAA